MKKIFFFLAILLLSYKVQADVDCLGLNYNNCIAKIAAETGLSQTNAKSLYASSYDSSTGNVSSEAKAIEVINEDGTKTVTEYGYNGRKKITTYTLDGTRNVSYIRQSGSVGGDVSGLPSEPTKIIFFRVGDNNLLLLTSVSRKIHTMTLGMSDGFIYGSCNVYGVCSLEVSDWTENEINLLMDNETFQLFSPTLSSMQKNKKRIYTVEEATQALGKNNRNTFKLKYR